MIATQKINLDHCICIVVSLYLHCRICIVVSKKFSQQKRQNVSSSPVDYIYGVHLDKLSEYALTDVKHRLSGKHRALPNSLKDIGVQIIFCHNCSQREGSKTRELGKSKDIFMILGEAGVCSLPETPSLNSSMVLQSREKLQQ